MSATTNPERQVVIQCFAQGLCDSKERKKFSLISFTNKLIQEVDQDTLQVAQFQFHFITLCTIETFY